MARAIATYQRPPQSCMWLERRVTPGTPHSPIITQDLNSNQIRRFSNPKPFSSGGSSVSELLGEPLWNECALTLHECRGHCHLLAISQ